MKMIIIIIFINKKGVKIHQSYDLSARQLNDRNFQTVKKRKEKESILYIA